MRYHILNGDALAEGFDLEGEIVICREFLIEGDLKAKDLNEFWQVRSDYVKEKFNDDSYFAKVKGEFDKLSDLKPQDEVNLWFGDEAFCQVNMSFVLWLIWEKNPVVYRVFPDSKDWDCTFEDVNGCFKKRQKLTIEEVRFGTLLWEGFQRKDWTNLLNPVGTEFGNFRQYKQVCQALMQIDSKPREILQEIIKDGETDFSNIFRQFRQKAFVYGFGDAQVKNLLESI